MKRRLSETVDMNKEEHPQPPQAQEEETMKIEVKVKALNSEGDDEDDDDNDPIYFKIDTDIPLRWLMISYCQKSCLIYNTTRFEYNAAKLRDTDTPTQLGMLDNDVIYAFRPSIPGVSGYNAAHYVTICIRMHKERDTFLRVRRPTAILPQLVRCFSNGKPQQQGSLCFVYTGLKLARDHTADKLKMEDGDIIDGFNFNTMSSSLSIIHSRLTLKVREMCGREHLFKVTRNTNMGKLMDRVFKLLPGLGHENTVFLGHSCRLSANKTVEEEKLRDGDEIYLMLSIRGG